MTSRWTLTNRTKVFKNQVLTIEHRDFHYTGNGQTGTFTVVSMKDWAIIVPVTPDNKLILVKQFRVATGEETFEFPGGAIEKGEDPLTGATRELLEESGCSGTLTLLLKMRPNPAFMDNFCYCYIARECIRTSGLNLDPFEDLEPLEVSFGEFDNMIRDGRIVHSITLAAYGAYKSFSG